MTSSFSIIIIMGRAIKNVISSKGAGKILFKNRSHQIVAATHRMADEFAGSGENYIVRVRGGRFQMRQRLLLKHYLRAF